MAAGVAVAFYLQRTNIRGGAKGISKQPAPNAKIGDKDFDSENGGEFNAVATVEALAEVVGLEKRVGADGSGSNVFVVCGDPPDNGRNFWVVNVFVQDGKGRTLMYKTYHYDINTGALSNAATQPVP